MKLRKIHLRRKTSIEQISGYHPTGTQSNDERETVFPPCLLPTLWQARRRSLALTDSNQRAIAERTDGRLVFQGQILHRSLTADDKTQAAQANVWRAVVVSLKSTSTYATTTCFCRSVVQTRLYKMHIPHARTRKRK